MEDPVAYARVNYEGSLNLLELAKKMGLGTRRER